MRRNVNDAVNNDAHRRLITFRYQCAGLSRCNNVMSARARPVKRAGILPGVLAQLYTSPGTLYLGGNLVARTLRRNPHTDGLM